MTDPEIAALYHLSVEDVKTIRAAYNALRSDPCVVVAGGLEGIRRDLKLDALDFGDVLYALDL